MSRPQNSSRSFRCGSKTALGIVLGLTLLCPQAQAGAWRELRPEHACETYRPMSNVQLNRAESLFSRMLQGTQMPDDRFAGEWAELGYRLIEVSAADTGWTGLRETGSPCTGNGVYLFNRNTPGPLIIQAPHAYHDLYTGDITAGLMREGVAILAWNSAQRDVKDKHGTADLAKRPDSLFVALTRAMIRSYPDGRLIQIHGFDNKRRSTQAGGSAAVILSSGTRWTTRSVELIARCLRPMIEAPVLVYGADVSELGATRNFHGKALRRHGHEGFVHVELNRETRQRLKAEPVLLAGFSKCLGSGMQQ